MTDRVLEIAEALALAKDKPKRSIIFVWHTAEEVGLTGARYFTDNPTVPRDSIVANLNMDMIGRGRADDIPGGGPDYISVIGSNNLSSDLAGMVAAVNKKQRRPLKLDYRFDDSVTWAGYNNLYNRSDHAMYSRYNIPIAFFFSGLHADYHQLTDEPQYIDYPHYARVVNYIRDLGVEIANSAQRPRVDRGRVAQ
jgi:Zn-dependent M28 family amino/carboxypeptidase